MASIDFFGANVTFPSDPVSGDLYVTGESLFSYTKIGSVLGWYPLSHKIRTFTHTQQVSTTSWVVTHNLGTADVWLQAKDSNGVALVATKSNVTANSLTLTLPASATGTVLVVSPYAGYVPEIQASRLKIGVVEIDASGVRINGRSIVGLAGISPVSLSSFEVRQAIYDDSSVAGNGPGTAVCNALLYSTGGPNGNRFTRATTEVPYGDVAHVLFLTENTVYSPQASGSISSITVEVQFKFFNPTGSASLKLCLEQNGVTYLQIDPTDVVFSDWEPKTITITSASQLVTIFSFMNQSPDFSANAAPIRVGVACGNAVSGPGTYIADYGFGDITVRINGTLTDLIVRSADPSTRTVCLMDFNELPPVERVYGAPVEVANTGTLTLAPWPNTQEARGRALDISGITQAGYIYGTDPAYPRANPKLGVTVEARFLQNSPQAYLNVDAYFDTDVVSNQSTWFVVQIYTGVTPQGQRVLGASIFGYDGQGRFSRSSYYAETTRVVGLGVGYHVAATVSGRTLCLWQNGEPMSSVVLPYQIADLFVPFVGSTVYAYATPSVAGADFIDSVRVTEGLAFTQPFTPSRSLLQITS